jgi:hypothetical protein
MYLQSNFLKAGVALAVLSSFATACGGDDDIGPGTNAGAPGTGGSQGGAAGKSAQGGTGGSKTGGAGTSDSQGGSGAKSGEGGSNAAMGGDSAASGAAAGARSDGGIGGAAADGGAAGNAGGDAGDNSGVGVELGSAQGFAILAKSAISTVPPSHITGDIGVSPAAASYITGFSLSADSTDTFATSPQVTGRVYAADYAAPTASDLTTAVSDMELAFTDAAGRAPNVTELGAGDIGGMTLNPGVYQWGTGLLIPTDLTLKGSADGVWIFQIAQDLTVSSDTQVVLAGGALAKNVFWQVAGQVQLGTTAHFEGVVLSQTAVTLGTGASINGRLLAQTAVNLDANTVVEPTP